MHIGIDFGAKLSGYTAVAYQDANGIIVRQAAKGADADRWLTQLLTELDLTHCFIDAPLSLPGAYFGHGTDYFFRECDKLTKAMSPMFLGGLTARAMSLKDRFSDVQFVESYPKLMALKSPNAGSYKLNLPLFVDGLMEVLPCKLQHDLGNWHQVDALLAWMIGHRFLKGKAQSFGNPAEGLIFA